MENKILVIYVGIQGVRSEDIEDFVHKVATKIVPTTFVGEIIILPVQLSDTRVECINPKYITDTELITKNTELIKKLNEQLIYQLKELKQENNE